MTSKNNSKIYGYLSGNELEKYASICKYRMHNEYPRVLKILEF